MAPTTKSGKRASIRARAAAKSRPQSTTFEQLGQAFAEPGDALFSQLHHDGDGGENGGDGYNLPHQPTKRQKRDEKSTFFKSRIAHTAPAGEGRGVTKNRNAKKRATKKKSTTLTTSLAALADALPTGDNDNGDGGVVNEGLEEMRRRLLADVKVTRSGNVAVPAVKMKTLSTRPGMNKRREKLLSSERERFGRNMAVMMQEGSAFRTTATVAAAGGEEKGEVDMKDDESGGGAKSSSGFAGTGGAATGLKALRGFIQERLSVQNAMS